MLQDFRTIVKPAKYYMDAAKKAQGDKDYSYARKMLREGTETHPQNARLWQELAKSLRPNPKWDDATLRCFARAFELDPGSSHISMEYATFLGRKNQYGKAEAIYMSMLASEGETPRLFCALGNHFQLQKKYPLALASFERAYGLDPKDGIAQRRYQEVVSILGRDCTDNDRKALSFRVIKMTGECTLHKGPEIRHEAR